MTIFAANNKLTIGAPYMSTPLIDHSAAGDATEVELQQTCRPLT